MEPKAVKLLVPVRHFGEEVSEITIKRRRVGKDMREAGALGDNDEAKMMFYIERLCDLPPDFVDRMDGADIDNVAEAILPFLRAPKASQTGQTTGPNA